MESLQTKKKLTISIGIIVIMMAACSARMLSKMITMVTNSIVFPTNKIPVPGNNDVNLHSM